MTLTKPRIMSLLVLTAVCAMIAAAGRRRRRCWRWPRWWSAAALACGGASALNHVLDRDIDRLMGPRTASRPVAAGRISPARAVAFGLALLGFSFAVLAVFANLLAAVLALCGGAFYVLVYTLWLKRSTPQNIVIGGAAGAIPPLAGWAAANGRIGARRGVPVRDRAAVDAAALLGAGAAAGAATTRPPTCRCCRSCAAPRATARQVLVYSVVLVAVTLRARRGGDVRRRVPRGRAGARCRPVRACLAAVAERPAPANAALLFHFSLLYLALLFVAVAVDAAIR